jgi:hypothetical protein
MDEIEWLDASKVDLFHLCPRKYYYRMELGLIPKMQDEYRIEQFTGPLYFGTAIHEALAVMYRGEGFTPSYCPCPTFTGCEFCKGNKIPRMAAVFLTHYPANPANEKDARTRGRGIEILHEYLDKWRTDSFEVIAVEIPFEIPFYDDDKSSILFKYIGRIDILTRDFGKLKPWDHKTTSRFGEMFLSGFKLSTQCTGYIKATSLVTNEKIYEMDINAIRVTTKITEESFLRFTTTRDEEDLKAWEQEVLDAFKDIRSRRLSGVWPKHSYACTAYNRLCEYYPICSVNGDAKENTIEMAYTVSKWHPMKEESDS